MGVPKPVQSEVSEDWHMHLFWPKYVDDTGKCLVLYSRASIAGKSAHVTYTPCKIRETNPSTGLKFQTGSSNFRVLSILCQFRSWNRQYWISLRWDEKYLPVDQSLDEIALWPANKTGHYFKSDWGWTYFLQYKKSALPNVKVPLQPWQKNYGVEFSLKHQVQ